MKNNQINAGTPQPNDKNNSPINGLLKANNNTPPWVKNSSPTANSVSPPWAKNATQNEPSTIPSSLVPPQQEANKAPWIKNNQNAGQMNSQPSWIKNNPPAQTEPANQPAWAKNNANTGNQPSWAKNAVGVKVQSQVTTPAVNQPAWVKNNSSASDTANTPAWMKNNTNTSNVPAWSKNASGIEAQSNNFKLKQAADIERQKKQLEEKIRKQEEEEREKKRIQRENKEREAQLANKTRQIQQMTKQEEYSIARQSFQREEEARLERQRKENQQRIRREEEEKRLRQLQELRQKGQEQERRKRQLEEEQKRKIQQQNQKQSLEEAKLLKQRQKMAQIQRVDNKSKVEHQKQSKKKGLNRKKKPDSNLQNSKLSHISSIKGFQNVGGTAYDRQQSLPQNLYHKYLRLLNEEGRQNDYKSKIQIQKGIYQIQLQFRRECQKELLNLFASKKVTNRKRKFIFSNSMQIQYALCEGKKQQSGLVFCVEEVEELRMRFIQYQLLTKCILSLMRKKINLHLRVPLLALAQHKGVTFIVEQTCQELVDIIEIQIGLFQEIANEVLIFQKQLELVQDSRPQIKSLTRDQLMVKKISVYSQDYYVLYLRNDIRTSKIKKGEASNKLLTQAFQKFSQINDLSFLEYVINQNTLLPHYNSPFALTRPVYEQVERIGTPALKQIAKHVCVSQAINTVYSSCQGQVNEQSFFQLVLEGNKQIWNMISTAGSPGRDPPRPLALAYLQRLAAIRFNFSTSLYSHKHKELLKSVKPAVFIQRHDYQLLEFIKNLQKYIAQDKDELVQQSLALGRCLWQQISQNQSEYEFNFLKLKSEVSYLLYRQREAEALQMIEETKQKNGKLSLESIPLNLLALKIYIAKDMEIPLLKTLSELIPILQYFFGDQSIIHAIVYTAIGTYYAKKTDESQSNRSQKVITFYEHALSIGLKLYGEKAIQVADIYLNRASAFLNLNQFDQFHRDIQNALKIYKIHSKSAPKIAQCNHLIGRVKCLQGEVAEGVELMESSSNQFMKMYNYLDSLFILFEILPLLQNKQHELELKIQRIVQICFTYKSVWAFRKIATSIIDRELNCYTSLTIQNLQDLFHPLEEDDRSNQEILIDLEEEIRGFTSFIEIVRWALSIIAGKLAARRQASSDYQKAHSIIGQIFHFYGKNQAISIELRESQLL